MHIMSKHIQSLGLEFKWKKEKVFELNFKMNSVEEKIKCKDEEITFFTGQLKVLKEKYGVGLGELKFVQTDLEKAILDLDEARMDANCLNLPERKVNLYLLIYINIYIYQDIVDTTMLAK